MEATAALRLAAGSRISQVALLTHSRTDLSPPRTLNLDMYAQVLTQCSRNKPDRLSEQDSLWYLKVSQAPRNTSVILGSSSSVNLYFAKVVLIFNLSFYK